MRLLASLARIGSMESLRFAFRDHRPQGHRTDVSFSNHASKSDATSISRIIVGPRGQTFALVENVEILRAGLLPLHHAETGRIVHNAASANRHASREFRASVKSGDATIDVTEMAFRKFEDRDIGILRLPSECPTPGGESRPPD